VLTGTRSGTNFDLAVLGSATIDPGGVLVMDGLGFSQSSGPGAGNSMNAIGSGAGYGGVGGASSVQPGGTNYGSAQQPVDRGSGGGFGWGSSVGGSTGGGALRMTVGGSLTVNGLLTTDGTAGLQDDAGGGSGGSLWLTAGAIGGSGLISAKGGSGELYQGGGGGGGRIALYYRSPNFGGQLTAAGGSGYFSGADGSIFTSTSFSPLAIVSQAPLGVVSNGVSSVDLQFNEPVNPNAASAFNLTTPLGPLPSGSITVSTIGAETLRVSFPLQTTVGDYVFTAGPPLQDLLGQTISQVYTGMFSISLPTITGRVVDTNSQPVAGVLLQPSGAMSPAVTDTNGNYVLGVLSGNDVTVVPSLGSLVFVPGARTYTNVTASISQQDYLAVNSLSPTLQTTTSGTNFVLSWYAIPGVTYQPYYSTNLVDWLPYSDPLPLTNGATQLLVPLNTDPAQFFRLRAQN
jgi:hypothetical protein